MARCPATGLNSATVTYTCITNSGGISAGTPIVQTFSVPAGPIAETVTYNANGPVPSNPGASAITYADGSCSPPGPAVTGTSACTAVTTAEIVPGGALEVEVRGSSGQQVQVINRPSTLGGMGCGATSGYGQSWDTKYRRTYRCDAGESIPAGTSVTFTMATIGATGAAPTVFMAQNEGAPIPASVAIPDHTMQTLIVGALGPTLASISPSSGPGGASVALTGANLTGATGVSFGTTAATDFNCNAAGTGCTATAPLLSAGTAVNVTVTTTGTSSNPLTFSFVSATTAAAAPNTANAATTPASTSEALSSVAAVSAVPVTSTNAVAPAATAGVSISYAAGWNIASGPTASVITGTDGPLYAYPAGSTVYQVVASGAPLQAGQGYWAFFDSAATVMIPVVGPQSINVVLPAGQWVLVGNPGNTAAGISGADVVYVYSAATGYQTTPALGPGQGAWVYSNDGGTVTISNR